MLDELLVFRVISGLTVEREAMLYYALNQETLRNTAYEKYTSKIVGKDPAVMEIEAIVKAAGLYTGDSASKHTIRAVRSLETVHAKYNNLNLVLPVLRDWDNAHQMSAAADPGKKRIFGAYETPFLRHMARFFAEFPMADAGIMAKQMVKYASFPPALMTEFRNRQTLSGGKPMHEASVAALFNIYNYKQRKKIDAAQRLLLSDPAGEDAEDELEDAETE
jgi:hypothetical protein